MRRAARDRLEDVLQRLAARRGDERVFAAVYAESARAEADASDRRHEAGAPLGALDGALVSVKDLLDIAGETTRAGSPLLADAPPATADAPAVGRLRRAGAVILGKTVMTEFAFTAIGFSPHGPAPGNAVDPSRIPGGSSSGAGVSVAEGTSEVAIGSDTGGSVRIPAALNGVVGFKPTARRVPLAGAFPLSPTLDSLGPLARSIAGCAAADAVMAGEESAGLPAAALAGLHFGIPHGRLLSETEPAVEAGFAACLAALGRAGASLADHPIDDLLQAMAEAIRQGSIASIEGAVVHAGRIAGPGWAGVDPRVRDTLARRVAVPAAERARLLERRAALAAAMDARLGGLDALVLPTVPIVAPPITALLADPAAHDRAEGLLLRNPQVANQFDLCAVTLPMPEMALPAGLMLVGRHGADRRLLGLAAAVEALVKR